MSIVGKHRLVLDTTDLPASDNVGAYLRASDGTLLTHTDLSGKKALDVNVANVSIAVTATDLDIRDIDAAQDNIAISDGTDTLAVNGDGSINSVVTATNLDIRDLTHVSDSVKIGDGTDLLAVNADGSINVNASISGLTFDYAEDSAHVSGDVGSYSLSVREDSLAISTSASGDYQSIKTDALGRMWMNETTQSMAHAAVTVGVTAQDLSATDLANRKRILVQNRGSKSIFIGNIGVTIATGIEIPSGGNAEFMMGPSIDLHAISGTAGQNVRVLELA